MLIESYHERMARHASKRDQILRFVRDETWSSALILGQVTGLSKSGIYKTLEMLESEQLIMRHVIKELRTAIWGITTQGLFYAWHENEPMHDRSPFEPSKVKPTMVQHHLGLQWARLRAERSGWNHWQLEGQLPKGLEKRPDAVVMNRQGQRIAIELERTVKTRKRYEVIFSLYLQAIKRGEYHMVHYVCPDPDFAARLHRLFGTIESVPVANERVKLNEKHRARFTVFSLHDWPPSP